MTVAGSRGDLQPYVALGARLRAQGDEVRVAAPAMFEVFVSSYGLDFYPIPLDSWGAISRVMGRHGRGLLAAARAARRELDPIMEGILHSYSRACEGADAVVYSPVGFLGRRVAQAQGIPSIGAACQPFLSSTGWFPSAFVPPPNQQVWMPDSVVWRTYNRLTYTVSQQLLWRFLRRPANRALSGIREMSPLPLRNLLADLDHSRELILNGWSPRVLPRPPDWGDNCPVTGYWVLSGKDSWTPPAELTDFLASGSPPVVIGFGSIAGETQWELRDLLVGALRRAGRRGVMLTGWSGLSQTEFPADVYGIQEAPHDWIMPRADVVVHHGGAGTTGAALRAGVPQVVMPWYADQPFWARRVASLGTGLATSTRARISEEELGDAIRRASTDAVMRRRAEELGGAIRAEDGVGVAVECLWSHLESL